MNVTFLITACCTLAARHAQKGKGKLRRETNQIVCHFQLVPRERGELQSVETAAAADDCRWQMIDAAVGT